MTEPGYPDYARMSLATGFLLAGGQQAITANVTLYQGYVGSWPYINSFFDGIGGVANYQITLAFFTDGTFTQGVAQVTSTRNAASLALRQYACLSPWVIISVRPDIGTDNTLITFAFYGTTQRATSAKLASMNFQFYETFPSLLANEQVSDPIDRIFPGAASVSIFTKVATAQFDLQRWDFILASWQTFWLDTLNAVNTGFSTTIALPDAPIRAQQTNLTGVTGNVGMWIMPLMD